MSDIASKIIITNAVGTPINPATEETLESIAGLVTEAYDYISLSYTGTNLTGVVYKIDGSGGTTVATLTLAYNGSDQLTSVTKT